MEQMISCSTTEQMRKLDRAFTARNLSPGGCADLLALSLFLFFMGR